MNLSEPFEKYRPPLGVETAMSQALVKALHEVQPEEKQMEPKSKKRSKRRVITKAELKRIIAMREAGIPVAKIAVETGRAVSSVWRVLQIAKQEKKEIPSFLKTAPAHAEVTTPQNVIRYNISPNTPAAMKPVTQEKEAGWLQRMAISFCKFLGVTDSMYEKH